MPVTKIQKPNLRADEHVFRLSTSEECTAEVLLAGEPDERGFPLLVQASVTEPDGTVVQLPRQSFALDGRAIATTPTGETVVLHPDRIAQGHVTFAAEKGRLAMEAAERMDRYLPQFRATRQMRRAAPAAPPTPTHPT